MLTPDQLRALAQQHRLPLEQLTHPSVPGTVSQVYLFDRFVLRTATDDEGTSRFDKECRIIPLAREAGVRTPALLARGFVEAAPPIPYMLLERTPGDNLGPLGFAPKATAMAYRELGRDLGFWHGREVPDVDPLQDLERDDHPDPRPALAHLVASGHLPEEAAEWVHGRLDQLAAFALTPRTWRVVHGDARPTNIMIDERLTYRALLDWGDAQWADPASEFALMPLRAVPYALEGYREVRGSVDGEVSEARVLWYQLAWAVLSLGRGTNATERTWSSPPAGRLLELLRFMTERPGGVWAELLYE